VTRTTETRTQASVRYRAVRRFPGDDQAPERYTAYTRGLNGQPRLVGSGYLTLEAAMVAARSAAAATARLRLERNYRRACVEQDYWCCDQRRNEVARERDTYHREEVVEL